MTLAGLRKFSIVERMRIRFALPGGLECVITEHGIAQVPSLDRVPDFNLEESLAAAAHFTLEAAVPSGKTAATPQSVTRERLAALADAGGPASAVHDDREE